MMITTVLKGALDIFLTLLLIGIVISLGKMVFNVIKFLWKSNAIQIGAILFIWEYFKLESYVILAAMIIAYVVIKLSWSKFSYWLVDHVAFLGKIYERHNLRVMKKYNVKIPNELKNYYTKEGYNI